jgi:SNF2 family DNA or RNA helicase
VILTDKEADKSSMELQYLIFSKFCAVLDKIEESLKDLDLIYILFRIKNYIIFF